MARDIYLRAQAAGTSLHEDVDPDDGPAYLIGPAGSWHPDRVRIWIALSAVGLLSCSLAGLFVLILLNVSGTGLLVWQGAVGAVSTLTATVVTYYFTKRATSAAAVERSGSLEAPTNTRTDSPLPAVATVVSSTAASPALSVAIVGSFRRYYDDVVRVINIFREAGLIVSTPAVSRIVNPEAEFVRFETDPNSSTDHEIQERTLERILSSDLVYVVAPDGYVGRTTCYELGHASRRRLPIYFSDRVKDLPINISDDALRGPAELARAISKMGRRAL